MNEWIIIAIVAVILLFSAKKLPDMARGLGQSMRIFKAETRGMKEDEQGAGTSSQPVGEVAPGRVAGSVDPAANGSPANGSATNGSATNGAAPTQTGAGTADGAPRAGS